MADAFIVEKNTELRLPEPLTPAVGHAVEMFQRDVEKVLGSRLAVGGTGTGAMIAVDYAAGDDEINGRPEAFAIRSSRGSSSPVLRITGSDDLGIIYGLLGVSRDHLGVDPFWFWTEKEPPRRTSVAIPARDAVSPPPRVRYRGWFVNDEVCLIGWTDAYPPPREVWHPVFEALLRCGGNLVIPGTDLPRNGIHYALASEMGLYVTHHHAEPLGAEMFSRAYPDKEPSFSRNPGLFESLWEEAIRRQKDSKIVWVLGFRGQGDCPFWAQDAAVDTPESRGELISRVIRRQYDMVRAHVANPACCMYVYGEITGLYRAGRIEVPDGVIKIWSDNGYGKMVSRRQGNENPRLPSLPRGTEKGPHGVYYHATFHDLQASSHLAMLANPPELVQEELCAALRAGADECVLVNSGNIRPHILMLDLAAEIWNRGEADAGAHLAGFGRRFFPSAPRDAAECYRGYFNAAIRYGENEDDRAGDEFYHHPARRIVDHWMKGKSDRTCSALVWAAGEIPFERQVADLGAKCESALPGWDALERRCLDLLSTLKGNEAAFFSDNLVLQTRLHRSGCRGLTELCRSFAAWSDGSLPLAFVRASRAIWSYRDSLDALSDAEHGKWRNFYRADWLTNVKSTVYSLEALRKYLRILGDSPDFFLWYRELLMPDTERKIYLENTHRRPLSDDELAKRLEERLV